jgi:iron complex transport system permease protein
VHQINQHFHVPTSKITIIAVAQPRQMGFKSTFSWFLLTLLLCILFIADLATGSVEIPISGVINALFDPDTSNPVHVAIITDFRLTKAITCLLAGAALSLSGLQMQTLFRNPLAGPDVLGLSSGASLAVSLVMMGNAAGLYFLSIDSPWSVAISASAGSAIVFFIMLAISRRLFDNVSLLIIGLMIGAATSSIVSVLQFLSRAEEMQVYLIWTFGSLGNLSWEEIHVLLIVLTGGFVLAIGNVKALNAWVLGERYNKSLGINVGTSRMIIIFSASLLTGGVTAFCGPIAFVGLAVPHLVKMLIPSADHRRLIPAVMIGGGSILLFCDIISQLPRDYILPVNAITALIGAPVVIWVIMKNRRLQRI